MLRIYLCEDNDIQRTEIESVIKDTIMIEELDLTIALSTADPHAVIKLVKEKETTGLYFLDLDLNADINGLVLAQEIRKYDPRGFIVFITSHSEMSYMTFLYKVEAMDFILKDTISEIKHRIHECILSAYSRYSASENEIHKTLTIRTLDRNLTIELDEILFLETSSNLHKIILHAKNRQIEFSGKLKDMEDELDENFYRCHRSYIVNKKNIKEVDIPNRTIHMINGEVCYVSTRMVKGLM